MLYLIIILHFLSDWILQPRSIARTKSSSTKSMLVHLSIIHIVFSVFGFIVGVPVYWIMVNTLSHFIIDKNIWTLYKKIRIDKNYSQEYLDKNKYAEDYWYYFTIAVDQIIHLSILIFIFHKVVIN